MAPEDSPADNDEKIVKEDLAKILDDAEWAWLKPHLDRDALILVSRELDLLDVGSRIVGDDSVTVQGWTKAKLLSKPTAEQIQDWNQHPEMPFRCLIIQPYVLIQEKHFH